MVQKNALAKIWDDDAPVISIANAPSVVESDTAEVRFPITALVSPNKSINVKYELREVNAATGDFITEEGSNLMRAGRF